MMRGAPAPAPGVNFSSGDDEEEFELLQQGAGGPPEEDEPAVQLLGTKDMAKLEAAWRRPPLPPLDPLSDELVFQQFEADYTVAPIPPDFARGSPEQKAAVVASFNEGVAKKTN